MTGPPTTTDLIEGFAVMLADAGLGTWRPSGVYTAAETGITVAMMPPEPDRAICLTPYPVADGPMTEAVVGVQVRMRAGRDPRAVLGLADGVFDLLHNRAHAVVGGIKCPLIWRNSQAWIGADSRDRMELTANYYLNVSRPAGANLDP
ncbi:minor capsid protein [Kitasatospora sp. NPDC057738]|uniref:minor capsid protein n=1 Tax=Kitasatospora sp. NPDC057738 TaxID=3346233 RepID=UPI0036A1446F